MEMVMEMVLTLVATVLLSFLMAKLVSAAVGGGGEEERRREVVVVGGSGSCVGGGNGRRRSVKRVRFVGVEERMVVDDPFDEVDAAAAAAADDDDRVVVEERGESVAVVEDVEECVQLAETSAVADESLQVKEASGLSEMSSENGGGGGGGFEMDEVLVYESVVRFVDKNDICGDSSEEVKYEQVIDADENYEVKMEEAVGLDLGETNDESLADIVGSCQLVEALEIIGVVEEKDGGKTSILVDEVGAENVECSHPNEVVSTAQGEQVDVLLEPEENKLQAMDVENVYGGEEEMNEKTSVLVDEVGAENVECSHPNEVVCTAQHEHVDELLEEEENKLEAMDVENVHGGEEEMNDNLKDALTERIEEHIRTVEDRVIAEPDNTKEGYKLELEVMTEPKDAQIEQGDEPAGEIFGSIGEDDWEGIEMSKLDNDFTVAAAFVRKKDKDGKLSSISNEVKMQLYGLQKIVMEGPCREPQPMALKISARAKWNAWQRLGNMNPEDAMKQYIALVSDIHPEWRGQNALVDDQSDGLEAKKLSVSDPDHSKPPNESEGMEASMCNFKGIDTGGSSLEFKD